MSIDRKYLLSKAWGFGFFSDVFCTLSHFLIAEITGRTPLVSWQDNSLFSDGSPDCFPRFFKPLEHELSTLDTNSLNIYPDKWSVDTLSRGELNKWEGNGSRTRCNSYLKRDETLFVCDFAASHAELKDHIPSTSPYYGLNAEDVYYKLINKYLKPSDEAIHAAKKLSRNITPGKSLAVHFRGLDKVLELENPDEIDAIYELYFHSCSSILKGEMLENIYLMTDDSTALQRFNDHFKGKVYCTDILRGKGREGVHYEDKSVMRGMEVLADALIALNCDAFVGNGLSNASCFVHCARKWNGNSLLLGGNMLKVINNVPFTLS